MMRTTLLILAAATALSKASLLVDYQAPDPASTIGQPQLQDDASSSIKSSRIMRRDYQNDTCYIKPGQDPDGRAALHFHRDPSHRRAEVKAKGDYSEGKKYFVGYEFRLSNIHEHLALFQWKKTDKTSDPVQNIPFNIQFSDDPTPLLTVGYTEPGQRYRTIWTAKSEFDTSKTHNIALAWDTGSEGCLQMWLDGEEAFTKKGLTLWTGDTYPKFGIYRGERGDRTSSRFSNIFDMWLYRAQISDSSLEEIAMSSGLKGEPKAYEDEDDDEGAQEIKTVQRTKDTL